MKILTNMKKEYCAPAISRYAAQPLMISVSVGADPVTSPDQVESRNFWGGSIFDDETEKSE